MTKDIIKKYKDGLTISEIANIYSRSLWFIHNILVKNNIKRRKAIKRRILVTVQCLRCKKDKIVRKGYAKYVEYCSQKCYWESLKEKKLNLEQKDKLLKAGYGSRFVKGHLGYRKNKNRSNKFKHIRSLRECTKYKNWRKQVFERDNYTCVICKKKGGHINADHIKPLSRIIKDNKIKTLNQAIKCKELWSEENVRTLCLNCHRKTETFGSRALKFIPKCN